MSLELPRKWWQWMIAVVLAIIIVFTGLFLSGMHTGRLGFVPVEGNSMQSVFPWGTAVFVIPVKPRDGDYVVAWATDDDPETQEDKRPGLVVKKLDSGQLVSTDINQTYKSFEIRGMVIGQLPIQRVCWWMDKGTQKPAPIAEVRTVDQQLELTRETLAKKRWIDEFETETEVINPLTVSGTGDLSALASGGTWTNPSGSSKTYTATLKYDGKKAKAIAFRLTHTGPAYFRLNGRDVDVNSLEELPDGRKWLLDPGEVWTLGFELGSCMMMGSIDDLEVRG